MAYLLHLLGLGGAFALTIPRQPPPNPCTFVLTATGNTNGPVESDTIGDNRLGGGYPPAVYYMLGHSLFDSMDHSCTIDPSTKQFQCIQDTSGTTIFELGDDGNLVHDGCENWLACPTTGSGSDENWNIYGDTKTNTTGCNVIQLRTGEFSCSALGRPSSSSAVPTPTPNPTAQFSSLPVEARSTSTSPSAASCPTNINAGKYLSPSNLILTSPTSPTQAFGTSPEAFISPLNTTLYSFSIPHVSYTGTCALLFLFPFASDLNPSTPHFYFSGLEQELGQKGGLDFAILNGVADNTTTYETTPAVTKDFGKTTIQPGNNYTIGTFPCGASAGEAIGVSGSSINDTELDYYQGSKSSAIGLYIVPCS